MSYVRRVLRQDETVIYSGRLHWIIYGNAWVLMVGGLAILLLGQRYPSLWLLLLIVAGSAISLGTLLAVRAWFDNWITEIAVTNRRVIYKKSFIRRRTAEMNMDKVESVTVTQTLTGRLLGYGTIHVRGTGEGIEHLHRISSPIALRNSILVR